MRKFHLSLQLYGKDVLMIRKPLTWISFTQHMTLTGPAAHWLIDLGNHFKPGARKYGCFFKQNHKMLCLKDTS